MTNVGGLNSCFVITKLFWLQIIFVGYNCWNIESKDNRPTDGIEGSASKVSWHEQVFGQGGSRGAPNEPRDHIPTSGYLQPSAWCYKPMFCQEFTGMLHVATLEFFFRSDILDECFQTKSIQSYWSAIGWLHFALNFTELLLVYKWVDLAWINISSKKNQTNWLVRGGSARVIFHSS